MSSLLNKAKLKAEEALHKSNTQQRDNPQSTNQGPHSSNVGNTVDPRVDSDGSAAYGYGAPAHHATTGTTGYGQPTHTTGGYGSTNEGPHNSNLANKMDPRVDSDRDNRNDPTSRVGGYGTQDNYSSTGTGLGHSGAGHTGHTGHSGVGHTGSGPGTGLAASTTTGGYGSTNPDYVNNPQSTTAGPHSSNMANKLDPRVDSDRDGRNDPTSRTGGYGQTQEGYGTGAGLGSTGGYDSAPGHTGTGYGQPGHTTHTGGYGSSNAGPHDSNMANKLDPRVDSDRDNRNDPTSRVGGYGTQDNYGSTGTGLGSGAGYGQTGHTTHTGTGGYGSSATPGSGNADKTAGPHNSNLLNKLDPRVDSDADGSKTYGGNKTNY